MAHPTRGRRTGTYEIEELVDVDLHALRITFRHAGAYQNQTVVLKVEHTEAAEQLLQAMADSIKIGENGDSDSGWESAFTLRNAIFYARIMHDRLVEAGFRTFSDPEIDVPILRSLYQPLHSHMKRSACWLLARAVRDNHPNGRAVGVALKNSRFHVEDTNPFNYDDEVAEAIERAARGVFKERYEAQQEVFRRLGYDVSARTWLRIPAEQVVDELVRLRPEVTAVDAGQPPIGAGYEQQVAWALSNPQRFGYQKRKPAEPIHGPLMKELGRALFPDNVMITAALVIHCLGENAGFNVSVLLETSATSLIYLGSDTALEHAVKARSKTQDTRPTSVSSLFSPGGVIEAMTGLTRFSRRARCELTKPDGSSSTIVDRIYVEHTRRPSDAMVIDSERMQHAWRSSAFDRNWDNSTGVPREQTPLRVSALRLVAQRRAMADGLKADVHGHNQATKMHYSAHVLPDHVFNRLATAAQDAFHDDSVGAFKVVADATSGVAAELAAIDAADVMDVEIGLCTSAGNAPDNSGRRCDLGMVACFTCPNGYRTVDHIPGLLAAVELGGIIERNDPDEWENGQASDLRYYAQACLNQFPAAVVSNVRRTTDLVPHILTVTGMYMEFRHG